MRPRNAPIKKCHTDCTVTSFLYQMHTSVMTIQILSRLSAYAFVGRKYFSTIRVTNKAMFAFVCYIPLLRYFIAQTA